MGRLPRSVRAHIRRRKAEGLPYAHLSLLSENHVSHVAELIQVNLGNEALTPVDLPLLQEGPDTTVHTPGIEFGEVQRSLDPVNPHSREARERWRLGSRPPQETGRHGIE